MNTSPNEKQGILKKVFFFLKLLEIRLRFVVILVITALIVGYWDTLQNYVERWTRSHPDDHHVALAPGETEFFCPMHPFVVREELGKCPICGMDLVARKRGERTPLPEGTITRVQVSPERMIQSGVQIEPVSYRLLSQTIHSFGTIAVDESRLVKINARFPGRVEELFVNAIGMTVNKGDPLWRIYSPKYLAAASEYQQAVLEKSRLESDHNADKEAKRAATEMAATTRLPLERQGFTKEQLDEIAQPGKTNDRITFYSPVGGTVMEKNVVVGEAVDESMILFTVADLSTLWVYAQVIESDLSTVKIGLPVEVTSVAWPGKIFYGAVDLIEPVVNPESRSVKVRVVITNKEGKLKPGMYVSTTMRVPLGRYGAIGSSDEPIPEMPSDDQAYPLDYCVISGEKLGSMGEPVSFDYAGRNVKFCCADCIEEFKEAPAQYLAILDEAAKHVKNPAPISGEGDKDVYTCPMHPEVLSNQPGTCPKCGMALVRKPHSPQDSASQQWAEGYGCAMHPDKLQPEDGMCEICDCGMKLQKMRVERVLSIPETAVIDTGRRQIVYVETMPGVYDAHAVTLGHRTGDCYPVLKGLSLGDRIVTRGSFLIDAEARLNPSNN